MNQPQMIAQAENNIILNLSLKHYEKRSEVYPMLYEILSDFVKILDFGKLSNDRLINPTIADFIDFLAKLEYWDSKHAIFLTPHSTKLLYSLRQNLYKLISSSTEENVNDDEIIGERKKWTNMAVSLESSLKYELGIFTVYPFPGIGGFSPLGSYEETENLIREVRGDQPKNELDSFD